ncbi:hypothetical protein SV7mr_29400 [Stieleria bergensis]|uniref:Uncharacterized protein n=1 Tax=Stieleria bergensis TaxID=2528025 RepID=A0A517SWB3_9BACT|nr:hypothetical protein SV7mr_29400 [Planctomycetes bacterium SV_7m_r]
MLIITRYKAAPIEKKMRGADEQRWSNLAALLCITASGLKRCQLDHDPQPSQPESQPLSQQGFGQRMVTGT